MPAERNPALGRAEAASRQIERAVHFIRDHHGVPKISIIAHSWGTIATGRFAGSCPDLVERLVFFGPITWRQKKAEPQSFPAWRLVSLKDQWDRFTAEVPPGESAVLSKHHFDARRRKPSCALPRDADLPQRRRLPDRAIARLTHPDTKEKPRVRRNLRSPT